VATPPTESLFGVGGVVRSLLTSDPIAGAEVSLAGRTPATTDADGRFRFGGVSAGTHNLTTRAAGFTTTTTSITVPAAVINAYDIDLSP
jgi:hypothetical protein